jgi:hypothetical protein
MCKKIWNWLGSDHEQIKMFFTLIAALFILWQYSKTQDEGRTKQTMEFQARFAQGEIRKAYLDLNLLLIDKKSELDAAGTAASKKITELVKARNFEAQVMLLADFFGQVTTCVENNVCNKKVACSLFAGPAIALRNNFFDLFATWRQQWGEDFIAPSYDYFTKQCDN